ncbi:MAG: glycosyltransferase family 4 protein [Tumebacillaceae bacterium]
MRSIHVLQVLRPMEGGMRRHVLDLIAGLQAEGHHVTVACPPDSAIARELSSWVPCIALELKDGMNPMADFRAVRQLQQAMRREKFDIVHLHGAKAGYVGRLATRKVEARPPVVYTVHNHVLPRNAMLKRVMNSLERRLAPDADRVITVSHSLRREVCVRHGIAKEQAVTIHNGIDQMPPLSRQHARAILGCDSESRVLIGAIGRMVPEKGFDTLIDAFTVLLSRGIDADLVLIGDGPNLSDYQHHAGKSGLPRIRFLGEVPNACRLLKGFDVIAQPSHSEGLGVVAIEAMLSGCPVVATSVGGLPEVVVHGETGLLVPPKDEFALADALELLIELKDWREQLGEGGKMRAELLFSRQAMIQATLREYHAVIASREGIVL